MEIPWRVSLGEADLQRHLKPSVKSWEQCHLRPLSSAHSFSYNYLWDFPKPAVFFSCKLEVLKYLL